MIRLEVEDYCQDCRAFTPEVEQLFGGDDVILQVITCKYAKRCKKMVEYLKKQTKKEEKKLSE